MRFETIKRWGLMLENMCYLPYVFLSPTDAESFLRKYPEYVKKNVRIAPMQEVHVSEDMQLFYNELEQIRNRIITENC